MLEDVVDQGLDRGVFGAWEKGCPLAELDAVGDCGWEGNRIAISCGLNGSAKW